MIPVLRDYNQQTRNDTDDTDKKTDIYKGPIDEQKENVWDDRVVKNETSCNPSITTRMLYDIRFFMIQNRLQVYGQYPIKGDLIFKEMVLNDIYKSFRSVSENLFMRTTHLIQFILENITQLPFAIWIFSEENMKSPSQLFAFPEDIKNTILEFVCDTLNFYYPADLPEVDILDDNSKQHTYYQWLGLTDKERQTNHVRRIFIRKLLKRIFESELISILNFLRVYHYSPTEGRLMLCYRCNHHLTWEYLKYCIDQQGDGSQLRVSMILENIKFDLFCFNKNQHHAI